jgi:ureidoacrylate peracid hydrolase
LKFSLISTKEGEMVNLLEAQPQPLEIDWKRTAVIIIDMQNAFISKGGMFDLRGFDISSLSITISPIKRLADAARARKIRVIYVSQVLSPDLREVGPVSPYYNNYMVRAYREKPEWRDKLLLRGTWGAQIIDELKPQESDILVEKPRFSAFAGTDLDMILKTYDIRYLIFSGVATNICVESSLRDACHLQYFSILTSDAAAATPASRQEASIGNIIQCFGWVTDTEKLLKAML